MRVIWQILGILSVACWFASVPVRAAQKSVACGRADCAHEWVYFGTRSEGAGQGIQAARLDVRTGQLESRGLMAEFARPTWLHMHPSLPVLYAVSELGNDGHSEASVYSMAVDAASGQLHVLNNVSSGGGGATHLAVDAHSGTLFVANYGSGSVAALSLLVDGRLGAVTSVQRDSGTGPSPRQQSPHAHSVELDPSHRYLISADLGADRIFIYHFDARTRQLAPADPPATIVAPGSGPRHTAFQPDGRLLLLVTELSADLQSYRWDARHGRLQLLHSVSTSSPDFKGERSASEVAISRDGRFVYVANRGEDTLLVYALQPVSGELALLQRLAAQGHVPWGMEFDLSGRWLLVANQGSDSVNVFAVDAANGKLSGPQATLSVPKPSSVAFAREQD
jgi:6-phosphogluconolactonase